MNAVDLIPWRCDITGNPVGTDTRMIGAPPCDCQGCRAADTLAAKDTALAETEKNWQIAISMARLHEERATAAEAELVKAREIVRLFLIIVDETKGGLSDCIDNTGTRYQSRYFSDIIAAARAQSKPSDDLSGVGR